MIQTRDELINYALRRLGAPVITIDVDPDQIEDRVDDALDRFIDFHYEGTEHVYWVHQFTQEELDQGYVNIPNSIIYVDGILDGGIMGNLLQPMGDPRASWVGFNPFVNGMLGTGQNPNSASSTNDHAGGGGGFGISDFFLTMNNLEMMGDVMGTNDHPIQFNRHTHKIHMINNFIATWEAKAGAFVAFNALKSLDPEEYNDVYNDRWLKEYLTYLIQRNWGANLRKFGGIQLPGAVDLDGDKLYDDAQQVIDRLEEEMLDRYTLPPLPEFG